jgi:hypothetical protein
MKATIEQAENNTKNLTIEFKGYGHWKIECDHYGKRISTITTASESVDNFKSDFGETDDNNCNRRLNGYVSLCEKIIRHNKM